MRARFLGESHARIVHRCTGAQASPSHAAGSALRSSTSTSAEPTMTPSTCGARRAHLLAAADAESRAHRNRRKLAHAVEVVEHSLRHLDALAGRSRHGDRVDESLALPRTTAPCAPHPSPASPSGRARARPVRAPREFIALIKRQIRHDESGRRRPRPPRAAQATKPERQQRIQITHQNQRDCEPWQRAELGAGSSAGSRPARAPRGSRAEW